MSSVFSGYPVKTKGGSPRTDQHPPTDPDSEATQAFYLDLYRDINGAGAPQPTLSFAIGENVDVAPQQSVHSTMKYLLDFLRESGRTVTPPSGTDRLAYIATLAVGGTKPNVSVITVGPNLTVQESDLDQDAVNLVIYIFGPDAPEALATGPGIFYTMGKRLIELARELDYFTVGQPRRLAGDIGDEAGTVGNSVTFTAPTWSEVAPQEAPDVVQWVVNGLVVPGEDGTQDLLVENLTLAQDGDFYRTRAGYIKPGKTIPDSWKHSGAGTLTVT